MLSACFVQLCAAFVPIAVAAAPSRRQLAGSDPIPLTGSWLPKSDPDFLSEAPLAEADAAVCFRGQLRGLTPEDLSLLEAVVLSQLFLSADVFVVVPARECEEALSLYRFWEASSAERLRRERGKTYEGRAWRLAGVVCTLDFSLQQERRFAGTAGPPFNYPKDRAAIEMRQLWLCGQAITNATLIRGSSYQWVLSIRPDFIWCSSPPRGMLDANAIVVPDATEKAWYIGLVDPQLAVGPQSLMAQYFDWYNTIVRNESMWHTLRTLRLQTGSSLKYHDAKFGAAFGHEQSLDFHLFLRDVPVIRTKRFERFRARQNDHLCPTAELCCRDLLRPLPDPSTGVWQNKLSGSADPGFPAVHVRGSFDFLLAGGLVGLFQHQLQGSSGMVLDLGCGSGAYALELNAQNVPCFCVEGDAAAGHVKRMKREGFGDKVAVAEIADFAEEHCNNGQEGGPRWRWVLLLDVLHFLPPWRQKALLEVLRQCASEAEGFVVSWAPPGQGHWRWGQQAPGATRGVLGGRDQVHLGEVSEEEALASLAKLGFVRDLAAERSLRLGVLRDYLREGLFVFRRQGIPGPRNLVGTFGEPRRHEPAAVGVQTTVRGSNLEAAVNADVPGMMRKEPYFLQICDSSVMDEADPLVPQLGLIWVPWEDCMLTLVQLRLFLFIVRVMRDSGLLSNALPHMRSARSIEVEWHWLRSQGPEALGRGRWDMGEMLIAASRASGCPASSSLKRPPEAARSPPETDFSSISKLGVLHGLCAGLRLGLWEQTHEEWARRQSLQERVRPKPYAITCLGGAQELSGASEALAGGCEGAARISYRHRIDASSPWFPHRHQLFIEQLYFYRLAMA
ncbi:unnamed protein product [Polarella glacialis]|uniref:Methyltransferase domain-containing protein n=1 Tax=Polarella glacialis TaxID=89957 RepID=A0A813J7L5_POLGL|nr:unnamed protein product [Polarella glacialis]